MSHRFTTGSPRHWANARLVRCADDFVVTARYQGCRIDEWLDAKLEGWLGLSINRGKTKVVSLHLAESLGFHGLGYPRKAFRDLGHYTRKRMVTHLNRRSQRKCHRPKGMSHYQYLEESARPV